MMQFWALIVDSFRESRDRKIFWVMLLIELLVLAAMACVGFSPGKVTILFGMWEVKTDYFTTGFAIRTDRIATIAVQFLMDVVVGWVGVTLALVATAGFFPSLVERGAVDILLAKPLSRAKLFLGKYVGSMVFVLLHAAFFIVFSCVIVGFRWHAWLPGYLWSIPLLVILFSYVYCVSAWAGIRFRSPVVAINISVAAWVFFAGIQATGDMFEAFPEWKENRLAYNSVLVARWCVPKTHDITYLAAKWSGAAVSTEMVPQAHVEEKDRSAVERAGRSELERMNINPFYTIGTSLGFEVIVVILAIWRFARSDY
ncbi:MAG: ABC transporter permease [Planctomycetota bacterium]